MRGFYLIVLFLVSLPGVDANAQGWLWAKGNRGASMSGWGVATDPVGNVFAAGIKPETTAAGFGNITVPVTGPSSFQSIITKYDAAGNVLWAKGTQGNSYLINIAADKKGNSFMFGVFGRGTYFGGNDSSGTGGGSTIGTLQIGPITLTCSLPNDNEYFLAKFDPSGNVLWAVNAGNAQGTSAFLMGTTTVRSTGGITTDAAGNVYITANYHIPSVTTIGGFTLTNANTSGSSDDILVVKYDPNGSVVWAKSVGGTGNDDAYGITVTPSGHTYIVGVFGSPTIAFGPSVLTNTSGNQVGFIARFDIAGNPIWASSSGGGGGEYAIALASDANSNVYMTGGVKEPSITFSGTTINNPFTPLPALYLLKFDPSNSVSWSKTIGWPPRTYTVTTTDSAGNLVTTTYTTGGWAWGYSVATSVCGDVWVSGAMSDTVKADNDIISAPPNSADPVLVVGYTKSGVYIGADPLTKGADAQNCIACDPSGNLFLCSDYTSSPFIAGSDTLRNNGSMYVAKHGILDIDPYNFKHATTTVCLTNGFSLQSPSGYTDYIWSNGHIGASNTVKDTGVYWVYSSERCGESSIDTFNVVTDCDCSKFLFIPNSFTPNNDGQNDVFYPRAGHGAVKTIKTFQVYNRWGELLHERSNFAPNDKSKAWDGTYQGQVALPEVYVYVVEVLCESGSVIFKKGSVTVIR